MVAARGMKVFALIDHSGEAKSNGLELRETKVVIFGSPQAGTPVMMFSPPLLPPRAYELVCQPEEGIPIDVQPLFIEMM
jgi:hypothetical protein